MKCKINNIIFPKQKTDTGVKIASYIALEDCEHFKTGEKFVAKGEALPTLKSAIYDFDGQWKYDSVRGYQFVMTSYKEEKGDPENFIKEFLSSGLFPRIGEKTAESIYKLFGEDALKIIETDPKKLIKIKGISLDMAKRINQIYLAKKDSEDVVREFSPSGFNLNQCLEMYQKYGDKSISTIKEDPFILYYDDFAPIELCEKLFFSYGYEVYDLRRISAYLISILKSNEQNGNVCIEYRLFYSSAKKLLGIGNETITAALLDLFKKKKVVVSPIINNTRFIYTSSAYIIEGKLAKALVDMSIKKFEIDQNEMLEVIKKVEKNNGISLDTVQRNAVLTALINKISVITGGPGSGKTLELNIITLAYKETHPGAKILLCAPTGRAARRMTQSTNMEAYTVHRGFNIKTVDVKKIIGDKSTIINCDLLIIDEFSMMDQILSAKILTSISNDTQIIIVGDKDQLPSVGPGNVLADIINSRIVPVSVLSKIYRQKNDSKVAINAKKINMGDTNLIWDDSFQFVEAHDFATSKKKMLSIYMDEVEDNGIDNVLMLTPYRTKSESGSYSLNLAARDALNPPSPRKREIKRKEIYREGDKVMQLRNSDEVFNGDIGYITNINLNDSIISVNFGFDSPVEYNPDELLDLGFSYAQTIHKSQGSESDVVIINLLDAHKVMLMRNLFYTAVTRAKRKVIIVGEMTAISAAIMRGMTESDRRVTLLSERIRRNFEALPSNVKARFISCNTL